MTAAEHEAWLKAAGQYDAMMERRRQQHHELQERAAEWRQAEAPLVEQLRTAGFHVDSVWDLVNTNTSYLKVLPLLLDHLQRPYPAPVREGIARALAVPEAKFGWGVLVPLYRNEQDKRAKDGLAAAIAAAADDEVIAEVIELAEDQRHGPSRLLLVRAIERSRDPRAYRALVGLATDPELRKEVQVVLHRLERAKGRRSARGYNRPN